MMQALSTPQALALVATVVPVVVALVLAINGWRTINAGHRRSARVIKAGEEEGGYVPTTVVWRTDAGPETRKTLRLLPDEVPAIGQTLTVIYPEGQPETACLDKPQHIYRLCYRWLIVGGVGLGMLLVLLLI